MAGHGKNINIIYIPLLLHNNFTAISKMEVVAMYGFVSSLLAKD